MPISVGECTLRQFKNNFILFLFLTILVKEFKWVSYYSAVTGVAAQ